MAKEQTKTISKEAINASVYDLSGKVVGKIALSKTVFGVKSSPAIVAQAVRVYQANLRLGTHDTKTRGDVVGSTRKIYRQKGTGRARHGDLKAPIFIGGGRAHGPKPRDYRLILPKSMRRKALVSTLSEKLTQENLKIVTGFTELEAKTKKFVSVLAKLQEGKKTKAFPSTLVVLGEHLKNVALAGRNIPYLTVTEARMLNAYDVLRHREVILAKDAVKLLEDPTLFIQKEEKYQEDKPKQQTLKKVAAKQVLKKPIIKKMKTTTTKKAKITKKK